jgi:hypothetical protein
MLSEARTLHWPTALVREARPVSEDAMIASLRTMYEASAPEHAVFFLRYPSATAAKTKHLRFFLALLLHLQ